MCSASRVTSSQLRLPADRRLRHALGGTTTSLNVRTAIAWLERLEGPALVSDHARRSWNAWATTVQRREQYDRKPMSDAAIASYVRELSAVEPTITKSRALRRLRDSKLACEQRRFGQIFDTERGA